MLPHSPSPLCTDTVRTTHYALYYLLTFSRVLQPVAHRLQRVGRPVERHAWQLHARVGGARRSHVGRLRGEPQQSLGEQHGHRAVAEGDHEPHSAPGGFAVGVLADCGLWGLRVRVRVHVRVRVRVRVRVHMCVCVCVCV